MQVSKNVRFKGSAEHDGPLPCRRDPWGPALARTERHVSELLTKLQASLQESFSRQVSEAVGAELNRFLEQPISALASSWELDVAGDGAVPPGDGRPCIDAGHARKDALRTKAFHLGA